MSDGKSPKSWTLGDCSFLAHGGPQKYLLNIWWDPVYPQAPFEFPSNLRSTNWDPASYKGQLQGNLICEGEKFSPGTWPEPPLSGLWEPWLQRGCWQVVVGGMDTPLITAHISEGRTAPWRSRIYEQEPLQKRRK